MSVYLICSLLMSIPESVLPDIAEESASMAVPDGNFSLNVPSVETWGGQLRWSCSE